MDFKYGTEDLFKLIHYNIVYKSKMLEKTQVLNRSRINSGQLLIGAFKFYQHPFTNHSAYHIGSNPTGVQVYLVRKDLIK